MARNQETGRAAGKVYGVDPSSRLLNEYQAAGYLGLAVATLRRWRWSGDGPAYVKLGKARGSAVRYSPQALADFVADGARTSTTDGRDAA